MTNEDPAVGDDRRAVRFRIEGLVQGVGFRYFVTRCARELSVQGWTRNLPDGHVEVLAQGREIDLEALAKRLAMGPPASRVSRVDRADVPFDEGIDAFVVRY